jgi:small subunit ribosomal protein S5
MAETAVKSSGRRRQRTPRYEENDAFESTTVGIYRTSAVVKGGRRFSFGALVVVGDRGGKVGIGYGKAPGVPAAIEKAQKAARKKLLSVELQGQTIPHPVQAQFGASIVRLLPAAPGTGVIAGATVRAVLELAGVRDCLTKAYGSRNQKNLCKAALAGLLKLSTREQVQVLRGQELEATEVEQRVAQGARYAPATSGAPAAKPRQMSRGDKPQNQNQRQRRGGPRNKSAAPATPAAAPAAPSSSVTPDAAAPAPPQRADNSGAPASEGGAT